MKGRYPVLIVFILLLGSVMASAGTWRFDTSKVHFYMYGMSTCPHCRHMKQVIPATYGPDKFTYYELNGNQHNDRIFENISRLTGITGVPAIGITYNRALVAVIEGEFNVSATPKIVEAAFDHNGTILFVGGRTYILPWNNTNATKVINELKGYFLSGEPEVLTTTTSNNKNSICGPAAIIGISVIPLLLRRRR